MCLGPHAQTEQWPWPEPLSVYHLGDDKPNAISSAYILYKRRVNQFGQGRYDKFRNTRTASGFRSSSTRLSLRELYDGATCSTAHHRPPCRCERALA